MILVAIGILIMIDIGLRVRINMNPLFPICCSIRGNIPW